MKNKRENLLLIIGMVIILGTHLVSCRKEPLPPPVVEPEELAPTLELTVTPKGVIPYGEERVVLAWETANATQVRVNDQRQVSVKSGTKTIVERLFRDTTFYVKAINIKKFVEKEVTIPVGDWTTSTLGLVSYYPWKYKAYRISRDSDGVILADLRLTEEELSWIMFFHRDGRYTVSNSSQVQYWSLSGDCNTIIVNGSALRLRVTPTEMIISNEIIYRGEPAWFDAYYEHASDTPIP